MSLWLDSLSGWGGGVVDLEAPHDKQEQQARHILFHLAMVVPKSWWEQALSRGAEPNPSHVFILKRLKIQLEKLPELSATVSYPVLVALPFAYCHERLGSERLREIFQKTSMETFVKETFSTLKARPELQKLGERVAQAAGEID